MCLAVPARVIEVEDERARVEVSGNVQEAITIMVPDVKPGDWVLLHAGFAINSISEEEAREIMDLWKEMG